MTLLGQDTFGTKVRMVVFISFNSLPVEKKLNTTSVTCPPTITQVSVKKEEPNPSGPGYFPLGIEKIACFTSSA